MYASIRRYRVRAGSMDDALHLADTELGDRLGEEPGFVDHQVMDTGDGTITSVTIFEDEHQSTLSTDMAADFVQKRLGDSQIERLDVFGCEVAVSRAAERVPEPAHRGGVGVTCRSRPRGRDLHAAATARANTRRRCCG